MPQHVRMENLTPYRCLADPLDLRVNARIAVWLVCLAVIALTDKDKVTWTCVGPILVNEAPQSLDEFPADLDRSVPSAFAGVYREQALIACWRNVTDAQPAQVTGS